MIYISLSLDSIQMLSLSNYSRIWTGNCNCHAMQNALLCIILWYTLFIFRLGSHCAFSWSTRRRLVRIIRFCSSTSTLSNLTVSYKWFRLGSRSERFFYLIDAQTLLHDTISISNLTSTRSRPDIRLSLNWLKKKGKNLFVRSQCSTYIMIILKSVFHAVTVINTRYIRLLQIYQTFYSFYHSSLIYIAENIDRKSWNMKKKKETVEERWSSSNI